MLMVPAWQKVIKETKCKYIVNKQLFCILQIRSKEIHRCHQLQGENQQHVHSLWKLHLFRQWRWIGVCVELWNRFGDCFEAIWVMCIKLLYSVKQVTSLPVKVLCMCFVSYRAVLLFKWATNVQCICRLISKSFFYLSSSLTFSFQNWIKRWQ